MFKKPKYAVGDRVAVWMNVTDVYDGSDLLVKVKFDKKHFWLLTENIAVHEPKPKSLVIGEPVRHKHLGDCTLLGLDEESGTAWVRLVGSQQIVRASMLTPL